MVVLAGLLGFLTGALHFASLATSVRAVRDGRPSWRVAALLPLRLVLSGSVLAIAAYAGLAPLAAALAGWMLARAWRLRAEKRT